MPTSGIFTVSLTVNDQPLPEIKDTRGNRTYAVCVAGTEYKIRLQADNQKHYGAIIQIDGKPTEAEFKKSPFTYFKLPYDDPGFWTQPSIGKYTPRIFSQPAQVESLSSDSAGTVNMVGRIRVYFFEVEYVLKTSKGRSYSTPTPVSRTSNLMK